MSYGPPFCLALIWLFVNGFIAKSSRHQPVSLKYSFHLIWFFETFFLGHPAKVDNDMTHSPIVSERPKRFGPEHHSYMFWISPICFTRKQTEFSFFDSNSKRLVTVLPFFTLPNEKGKKIVHHLHWQGNALRNSCRSGNERRTLGTTMKSILYPMASADI